MLQFDSAYLFVVRYASQEVSKKKVCKGFRRGILSKQDMELEFMNIIHDGMNRFLSDYGIIEYLSWTKQGPWLRFLNDYQLWQQGEKPCCKEGDIWLAYGADNTSRGISRGQEAKAEDKSQYFTIIV